MAALDWSQCPAIESVPDKVGGAWVFHGTRLPVATVIENLEDLSVEEVIEQFDVTREQVTAVPRLRRRESRVPSPRRCSSCLTTARQGGWRARFPGPPSTRRKPRVGTHSATEPC